MRKTIDRILTSSIWIQLCILLGVLTFFFFVFLLLGEQFFFKDIFEKKDNDIIEKHWYIITRLLDPGYLGDSKNEGYALSITIIGWIICTGLLIAIITNAYFERIRKIQQGLIQYKFKNHLVIFGYDAKTIGFINNFWKYSPKNDVVIMTEQNAPEVLRKLRTQIFERKKERRLIVLQGSRDIKEEIDRVRAHTANKIIVLGEKDEIGKDTRNIDCFELISKAIYNKKAKQEIRVYVHFEEVKTFQMAKDYDISNLYNKKIAFYPFNFHEQWAQRVFINYASLLKAKNDPIYSPLDWELITTESKKNVHLILLGYNRMSVALALEAARHCHFPNCSTTQITFFDLEAYKHKQNFYNQYQGIESLYDIKFNFEQCNVFDNEFKARLENVAAESLCLPYIAVCFDNSDFSLEIGLNLPKAVYQKRVPVIIRQRNYHHVLDSAYTNVRFFGMLEFSTIPEEVRDVLANEANKTYNQLMDYSQTEWNELKSSFKWANRGLVDNYPFALRSFNKSIDDIVNSTTDIPEDINIDVLSELEHRRWMAERVFSGWTYGEVRNDNLKIHPDLVPYSKLNKKNMGKDGVLVKQIFKSLRELGSGWLEKLPSDDTLESSFIKVAKVKAKQLSEPSIVETLENKNYRANGGDYLCIGTCNEKWAIDESTFYRKYKVKSSIVDDEGFKTYSPVPSENIVKAYVMTTPKVLTLRGGQKLTGKIGDLLVKDESTKDCWIVDYDVFGKSYVSKE